LADVSKYSTEDIIMTEIKHHTIRANDIRQNYIAAGEGAPVVLLHGFPETSYAWRHQIPELAKKYRVIAPDLRGYGETDKPATGYDKRNMAKDLRELMRALEIPKIALVGHDRGPVSRRASPKIIRKRLIASWSWTMSRPESSHATSTQ
jgi:pimeloyl-ACP methyl ester carboxylesterase